MSITAPPLNGLHTHTPSFLARHGTGEPRAESDERALRSAYLRHRDVPCPGCLYNLRNCTANTCPECGAALPLTVGPAAGRLMPLLMCVIAIAMPLGFNGILALLGTFFFIGDWSSTGDGWLMLLFWGMTGLWSVALLTVLFFRHALTQRSRRSGRTVVIFMVAAVIAVQVTSLVAVPWLR